MARIYRLHRGAAAVLMSALCVAVFWQNPAQAQMFQADVEFLAEDESIWGPGGAAILDVDYFVGPTWGDTCTGGSFTLLSEACATDFNRDAPLSDSIGDTESITTPGFTLVPEICVWGLGCTPAVEVPPVNLGTYGAVASGETAGQIGFDLAVDATSGDVDVEYGGSVEFEWPDPRDIGDTVTIDTSFTEGTTTMATNFPEASLTLDFVFDVLVDVGFEICIVSCSDLDVPVLDENIRANIFDISTDDLEVEVPLFGGITTVTAQFPDIDTFTDETDPLGNLMSEGGDDVLDITVDLDMIAALLLGLPPTAFGDSFSALGATASYTLLNVLVGMGLDVRQVFTFDPSLMVNLLADDGQSVTGMVGDSLTFDRFDASAALVTPTYILNNMFTSTTYLDITAGFLLQALQAGLSVDFGGIIPSFNEGFGPLVNESAETTLGSIPVFSTTYQMPFDRITGEAFVVVVPEPGTLALFGLGLIGIGLIWRRRRDMPQSL